ncbi:MAG TPA: SRPBCC domain-containing protein [Anaerolineales bacterium]|nr:SRPBCC domain-containing protein [Anaerolineales bacterium]
MNKKFIAKATTTIHTSPARVWAAITKPDLIKQYLFNTDVITDWKVGSPIIYRGEWQGKPFEDRGTILEFEPEKQLVSTHWSPLSGVPDTPENHHTVAYQLLQRDGETEVTITQDNNATEEEKKESEQIWSAALANLKEMLET